MAYWRNSDRGLLGLVRAAVCATFVLGAASIYSGAGLPAHAEQAQGQAIAASLEPLTLVTDAKGGHPTEHHLAVEVMRTDAEREHGLMDRRFLPADRGMLFQFDSVQPIFMWMKNTYIPLDMVFISKQGIVTHIHENAEPMSEAIISSNGPVYSVLEVNAGYAKQIGLKAGDLVHHSLFAN